MSAHNELGAKGERKAVLFLQKKNYEILATNWRYKRCEVDIIAKWKSIIVFAEVKTRSSDFFGHPEEAVDSHKRQMMATAARAYMEKNELENEIRFDILSLLIEGTKTTIRHIEDAFYFYE